MIHNFGRQEYSGKIQWIAPSGCEDIKGCVFRARRKVHSDELAVNPLIHIAAESYYALYFNGKLIGQGPARGTENCNFLDSYDIAEYVADGENIIAAEVFCNNFGTFMAAPIQPALFVSIGGAACDNSWQVQIASEYRTCDVPDYSCQIGLMEWRDLRKSPHLWQTCSDSTQWSAAEMIDQSRKIYSKKLFIRDIPQLSQTQKLPVAIPVVKTVKCLDDIDAPDVATVLDNEERFNAGIDLSPLVSQRPVKIEPLPENGGLVFIADFGDEFIGFFALDIDAPHGTVVDVGYQEVIAGDRLNLSISAACNYRFADRFILPQGRHCLSSHLRCRGGRFIQLTLRNFNRPITIHSLKVTDVRYPICSPSVFDCGDEFYNELWKRSLLTLSSCATDTILDCPWREMSFWVNDFLVVNRYWLQMTGQYELSRRCLSLALSQRRDDGLIPGVCPYDGNSKVVLFATNLFLPLILRDYLEYTGDKVYVEQVLSEVGDIVQTCKNFADSQGLLNPPDDYWNFVDWSFELNQITLNGRNSCVVNWFYVLALSALGDIYQQFDSAAASGYKDQAKRIAKQIEKTFWNQRQGCFMEYLANDSPPAGKLAHSLAILSGQLSDGIKGQVEQTMHRDDLLMPELYMMHFVFEALVKLHKPEEVENLIKKYWKPIIDSGCPTIWEMGVHQHGKSAIGNCGSTCHAFSLAPINYLQRHVLGLSPVNGELNRFSLCPNLGALSYVKGSLTTPLGTIKLACNRVSEKIQIDIEIPTGITVILPDGRIISVEKQKILI